MAPGWFPASDSQRKQILKPQAGGRRPPPQRNTQTFTSPCRACKNQIPVRSARSEPRCVLTIRGKRVARSQARFSYCQREAR